ERPGFARTMREEGRGGVVGNAAAVERAKEPQQLLGVRQRHRREDIPARDPGRGRRGGPLLEEAPLEQRPLCVAEIRQPSLDVLLASRRGHCRELPASSPSWSNRVTSSSERPSNSAIRPWVSRSGLSPISSTTCCDRVATVGKLKRAWSGRLTAKSLRSCATICVASSEWPPSAKKSSSTPTFSTPSTSAQ